jgi:hypothetical protein
MGSDTHGEPGPVDRELLGGEFSHPLASSGSSGGVVEQVPQDAAAYGFGGDDAAPSTSSLRSDAQSRKLPTDIQLPHEAHERFLFGLHWSSRPPDSLDAYQTQINPPNGNGRCRGQPVFYEQGVVLATWAIPATILLSCSYLQLEAFRLIRRGRSSRLRLRVRGLPGNFEFKALTELELDNIECMLSVTGVARDDRIAAWRRSDR